MVEVIALLLKLEEINKLHSDLSSALWDQTDIVIITAMIGDNSNRNDNMSNEINKQNVATINQPPNRIDNNNNSINDNNGSRNDSNSNSNDDNDQIPNRNTKSKNRTSIIKTTKEQQQRCQCC